MSSETVERWRTFCAIELPAEVRRRVSEHVARLREAVPQARVGWERAEKLHITLKFLGEIERGRVGALERAARRASADVPPFTLTVEGAGAFPPRGLPRVLWVGITDESGQLSLLQQRLEEECARENFSREGRAFHPHLTVARLRTPEGARRLAELHTATPFPAESVPVNELTIIRSILGPGGARYTKISGAKMEGSSQK